MGKPGIVPVTRTCWGGVFAAQYRDSLSCRSGASPSGSLQSATVARGSAERVIQLLRLRCSPRERRSGLRACACAAWLTPSAAPCSLLSPSDIVRQISALHASRPSRPRLSPLRSLEKMGAGKSVPLRGGYDAGGCRRRWEQRSTRPANAMPCERSDAPDCF